MQAAHHGPLPRPERPRRLHATRAHLLEMSGEVDGAIAEYRLAASRSSQGKSLPRKGDRYEVGDEIALDEADFELLSKAFFDEIESKYP